MEGILCSQLCYYDTLLLSTKLSGRFDFLGHNNEKMEPWEHVVIGTRQWLVRVSLDTPEAKDLLEVDLKRVERLIPVTGKMKNDNDQYTDTFVRAGNSMLRVIFLKGSKQVLSNEVNKMDYAKKIPKILQPNVKEIKSHLKSLEKNLEQLETRVKNLNEEASSVCLI